jgi:glycosyltransferase involved in cell wall biosynthesis
MKSERLRILMTTDAVGGVWVFSSTLAQALAYAGCEVLLVTLGPPPRQDQIDSLVSKTIRLEITDLALEWMDPEGLDFERSCRQLEQIAQEFAPDIVHLNSFREAIANWNAPVVLTAHSCVRSWWQACRGSEPTEPRWDIYIRNVRSGLAAAAVWAAPTAAFRDCIQSLYAPASHGHVVWNGIQPVGSASKQPFVLVAGRLWDEAKNIAVLVRVAEKLEWPLRICGATQSGVNSFELPARIDWLGELSRPDLLLQMQRAGIYVAPALYEPFGLAVLEAASAGCALVLADIPSFRELWDGAALFVDPTDALSIGRAINRLCEDSQLLARLQQTSRRRAAEYPLSRTAASYHELYQAVSATAWQPLAARSRIAASEACI